MKVVLGQFGVVLGSLWGHSELTLGPLLAYEDDFGMIMVSSWVYEGQFSKKAQFSQRISMIL